MTLLCFRYRHTVYGQFLDYDFPGLPVPRHFYLVNDPTLDYEQVSQTVYMSIALDEVL